MTAARPGTEDPSRPRRRDRRHVRHEQTRQEILRTAWQMARRDGLTALSLRALARAVGMEAQSLYTYFGSKHAVYDAMFAEGNRELLDRLAGEAWPEEPRAALRQLGRTFVAFSVEDQARHQLLFQNSIPDFAPSPDSYAVALEVFDHGRARLNAVGIADPAHVDLWTALIGGLAAQQLANDPSGNRWLRLVDEAVDMYIAHVVPGHGASELSGSRPSGQGRAGP